MGTNYTPKVLISGGPASGYKAEIKRFPIYMLYSPQGEVKDTTALADEALDIWKRVTSMKLSDILVGQFRNVYLAIRDPSPQEVEELQREIAETL